jgi:hypothetical protein
MNPIKEFIDNLGEVAGKPYAYAAYVCVLAAWTYITITRLQLKGIQALKPEDRSRVLAARYRVFPKTGLSGDEYIRSRKNELFFWGFVVLVVAVVLLGTMTLVKTSQVSGSQNIEPNPSSITEDTKKFLPYDEQSLPYDKNGLVIEKIPRRFPPYPGFKQRGEPKSYEVNGILEIKSDDRSGEYYYRTLTASEKDVALNRGWRLTCICMVESGNLFANIDFGSRRFDIELVQEGRQYFVGLTKTISPETWFYKMEIPVNQPHRYELRYDPSAKTASLWVDNQDKADGYPGHTEAAEDLGLVFGSARYSDQTGVGLFHTVRFYAH